MIQTEKRTAQILSARDSKSFLQMLVNHEAYYLTDAYYYYEAVHKIQVEPINERLVFCLVDFIARHPDKRETTFEILRDYLLPIYEAGYVPIDSKETPYYNLIYPVLCSILNHDELIQNKNVYMVRAYISNLLDIYVPTEFSDDIVDTCAHNLEILLRDTSDDSLKSWIFNDLSEYGDMDKAVFFQDVCHVRRLINRIFGMENHELADLFVKFYANYKVYNDRIDRREGIIGMFRKYYGDNTSYMVDQCMHMFGEYRERSMENPVEAKKILTNDAIIFRTELFNKYEIKNDDIEQKKRVMFLLVNMVSEMIYGENNQEIREWMRNLIYEISPNPCNLSAVEMMSYVAYEDPYCRVMPPEPLSEEEIAMEDYKRGSSKVQSAQANIYKAYKNYKNAEQKVDSQISKMVQAARRLAVGDVRTEIIEGKRFSAIGLLKKALGTAAVFSFGPIKGLILLVVRYALKKKTTNSERRKILRELQIELDMLNEKIEDARGDGNRQAKYAMMRTKAEIEAAINKIKYGLEVDERNLKGAAQALRHPIGTAKSALRGNG